LFFFFFSIGQRNRKSTTPQKAGGDESPPGIANNKKEKPQTIFVLTVGPSNILFCTFLSWWRQKSRDCAKAERGGPSKPLRQPTVMKETNPETSGEKHPKGRRKEREGLPERDPGVFEAKWRTCL